MQNPLEDSTLARNSPSFSMAKKVSKYRCMFSSIWRQTKQLDCFSCIQAIRELSSCTADFFRNRPFFGGSS